MFAIISRSSAERARQRMSGEVDDLVSESKPRSGIHSRDTHLVGSILRR